MLLPTLLSTFFTFCNMTFTLSSPSTTIFLQIPILFQLQGAKLLFPQRPFHETPVLAYQIWIHRPFSSISSWKALVKPPNHDISRRKMPSILSPEVPGGIRRRINMNPSVGEKHSTSSNDKPENSGHSYHALFNFQNSFPPYHAFVTFGGRRLENCTECAMNHCLGWSSYH